MDTLNIIGYIILIAGVGLVIADVVQLGLDVPMDVMTAVVIPLGIVMSGVKL